MAGVRFADVQSRPSEFLNLTSLTLEEFQVLVAPFEAAFQDHMAAWRLDGRPRTARRFTVRARRSLGGDQATAGIAASLSLTGMAGYHRRNRSRSVPSRVR